MNPKFEWLLVLASLLVAPAVRADALGLREYLDAVVQHNPDLQAQRESIVAAQAGVSVAGLRPDPQFSGGIASKELYRPNKPNASTALAAGVSFTVETGGKRAARLQAAQSTVRLAQATVGQFERQLSADAAAAFIESCRTRAVLMRKQASLGAMQEIVRVNEVRLAAGDVGRLELNQSRLEAQRFQAEVVSAGGDADAAAVKVATFAGQRIEDAALPLQCAWQPAELGDADALLRQALAERDDVRVAQAVVDSALDAAALARANRSVDPSVNLGLSNTPAVRALLDAGGGLSNTPAQRSLALNLTVSMPIPLSRLQDGELRQAESALSQARLQQRAVLLKAEGELRATFAQHAAALTNLRAYRQQLLAEAEQVLEGTRLSYRKGAASLLDLLNAQRSADEVYQAYLQAVADQANAQLRLQLSAGGRAAL